MTKQEIRQINSALRAMGIKQEIGSIFRCQKAIEEVVKLLKPLTKEKAKRILKAVSILHNIELENWVK